jgi:hypothetical protein
VLRVLVGPGPAQRIICKPEKHLKPQELTANMTPVEFAYWVDAFKAYHAGSHMEVAPIVVQQAFFKACVHLVLYNRIKLNIVSGVTPVLGQGNTVTELMRDEFLLVHSLFSRRLEFFVLSKARDSPCQMRSICQTKYSCTLFSDTRILCTISYSQIKLCSQ